MNHGNSVYEELVRVPLALWGPDIEAGRRTAGASLLDIAPTVCALAGVPSDAAWGFMSGRSVVLWQA